MFPILDNFVSKKQAPVTCSICLVILFAYLCQPSLEQTEQLIALIRQYAVSPRVYTDHEFYRLTSHIFLHCGPVHLLMNLWAIWFFGRRLEQESGAWKVLTVFFVSAWVGGLGYALVEIAQGGTAIGSSAGAFGLAAAYFLSFPDRQIFGLVLLIPMKITARMWFFVILAVSLMGSALPSNGVAYFTHLGGIVAAFVLDVAGSLSPTGSDWRGMKELLGAESQVGARRETEFLESNELYRASRIALRI